VAGLEVGERVTNDYLSQYGGPDTIRSAVVRYYGSFREICQNKPSIVAKVIS
jgi:hypothetical protein